MKGGENEENYRMYDGCNPRTYGLRGNRKTGSWP
jgi:hypothetical protein